MRGTDAIEAASRWLGSGDDRDFEAVYQKWHGFVVGLLWSSSLRAEDCEELAQDVMHTLYKSRHRIAVPFFEAWLRVVARNRLVSRLRQHSRIDAKREPLEEDHGVVGDERANLDREVSARQIAELLLASINGLPQQQRRCMLFRLQGHSHSEIAVLMRVAQGTVKATLHQARERLREALRSQGVEERDIEEHLA